MEMIELKTPWFTFRPFWWWDADSRIIEAFSAVLAFYWCFILILPEDTFGKSPSYQIMAYLGEEWQWALFYSIVWVVQSLALCGGVWLFRYPGAYLAMIGWAVATAMFALSNPLTHAPGIYGLLTLANLWVIIRGPTKDGR